MFVHLKHIEQQKEKKTYPSLGLPEDWSGWSARVLFEINPVTNHLLSVIDLLS